MRVEPKGPSTHGIHFIKTVAIIHQVLVHSQAWLTIAANWEIKTFASRTVLKWMLLNGADSMAVPLTAAAIFRLSILTGSKNRIQNPKWISYVYLSLSLMVLESLKQVLVYGKGAFFEWDALHNIAVSFLIILAVGRIGIVWLWPVALGLIFLAPVLAGLLDPVEQAISTAHPPTAPFNPDLLGTLFTILFMVGWAALFFKLLRSQLKERTKMRLAAIFVVFGSICVACLQQMQNDWGNEIVIRMLPIGALIGTREGHHIWGIFPWAGVTILGFLAFDIVVRHRALKWLVGLGASGLVLTFVFYQYFSDYVVSRCSPVGNFSGFTGDCFNRTPSQILLVVGVFLILMALGRLAEYLGWENRSVCAISRSVLWIYLFLTTVLQLLARWWIAHFPVNMLWTFTVFALVSCYLLAIIIDNFPRNISITFKKVEATA